MNEYELIKSLETPPNPNIPELRPGDSVKVHVRIVEGERERVQVFPGTVIRLRKGGNDANFTPPRTGSASNGLSCCALRAWKKSRSPAMRTCAGRSSISCATGAAGVPPSRKSGRSLFMRKGVSLLGASGSWIAAPCLLIPGIIPS
jgi:hypothetical protein